MPPRWVIRRNTKNLGILKVQNNIESSGTLDIVLKEDFGRDKDLKTLLKTVQPEPFTGEDLDNASLEEKLADENMARPVNRSEVHPVRVNALPITQGGRSMYCFECVQEGHKRMHCPQQRQNRGFQYQNRGPQWHNLVNSNQNRNQRISNGAHQNPNKIPVKTVANYLTLTDEVTEQIHVYAALDPSGRNRQYSILEAQGDYQGKSLTFLIDFGSSHSFISPSTVKHLHLEPRSTGKKLQVSLASGSIVSCEEQIVELLFQLEGHSTSQSLIVLKMGKFQGILGMDWLSKNKADIHCSQGTVSFYSLNGEQVYIHGRRGNASLRVVKAKQLIKGLRKGLSLYVLKLNKPEKESKEKEIEDKEPEWLSEFSDVFPKELIDLPPTRGLVHDITLEQLSSMPSVANVYSL
ncbi:hypothetical protein L7F22_010066 [Adiantum nelumboides]|nr:hypothetical protein [Adiantum nelumboides]